MSSDWQPGISQIDEPLQSSFERKVGTIRPLHPQAFLDALGSSKIPARLVDEHHICRSTSMWQQLASTKDAVFQ